MSAANFINPVTTAPLWTWDLTGPQPIPVGFNGGQATKTGLTPQDLQNYVGVPLQYYGNPPTRVPAATLLGWIRAAEDWVEQTTTILLCPTAICSPPSPNPRASAQIGLTPTLFPNQRLGVDYDLADSAYDYQYQKSQNEGWSILQYRYRPLRNFSNGSDITATKLYAFVYPLMSSYFNVPPSWFVEEQDYGVLRLVPAENVQMLPMFMLQLSIRGFSETLPGGIWVQYTAGLSPADYVGRFAFMKQLVLAQAGIMALQSIQGTINMGIMRHATLVDGVQYSAQYSEKGPFGALITQFMSVRDDLCQTATTNVSGPMLITI